MKFRIIRGRNDQRAELAYQMFEHTQQFENIAFDYGTVKRDLDEGKSKEGSLRGRRQGIYGKGHYPCDRNETEMSRYPGRR